MTATPLVLAAGGVVLRRVGDRLQVLVVHRVRHDDWSLPKGKLDPGESTEEAALREVEEETGVRARLVGELTGTRYRVRGARKHVAWYRMAPVSGDPADRPADDEVDVARWIDVEVAPDELSYTADHRLLAEALAQAAAAMDDDDVPSASPDPGDVAPPAAP